MSLSEEQVFIIVAEHLEKRDYEFFVHCNYESVRSKYKSHTESIGGRYPDILGFIPDNSVIAIEIKGGGGLKKGKSQARDYKAGSNFSYLAADASAFKGHQKPVRDDGIGVITVTEDGVQEWEEPPAITNKSQLPEIKARLTARTRGIESISKIAGLDLAHPIHFLAPALFLDGTNGYQKSMSHDRFACEFEKEYSLNGKASEEAIKGASALGILDSGPTITLTDRGRIGLLILERYDVERLSELEQLKMETSNDETLHNVVPLLAVWLLDQYRKHPDFEPLYKILESFDPGEPILLTDIAKQLIRDHPNTFLQLCCTDSSESRDRAQKLILEGDSERIYEDIDLFRRIIRQNLVQNFARQLQHIGLLSRETSSTTIRLEEYRPVEFPWFRRSNARNARLFDV